MELVILMNKLSIKAVRFLENARLLEEARRPALAFICVDTLLGKKYAVTADGYRIHAVPVDDIENGLYEIKDRILTPVEMQKFPDWQSVVPNRRDLRMVDEITKFKHDETEYVLFSNHVVINYLYYADIKTHSRDFTTLGQQDIKKPLLFEFDNGAFAIVMPLYFSSYIHW